MNVLPMRKSESFPSLSLADASPEYRELCERRSAINIEINELQRGKGERVARRAAGVTHGEQPVDREREARVTEILGPAGDPTTGPTEGEKLAETGVRIADLRHALETIEPKITQARMTASNAICREIEDRYLKLVQDLAKALAAAHTASLAYQDLVDALNGENVAWAQLGPVGPIEMFGQPRDNQSPLAFWFKHAVRYGLLKPGAVPDLLR
jgi:hypothetical protein